ncbi:MAG: fused MFS/spermidine synthase [Pseudomonadota bacterium]|nr:fused MFS/spermidine synthase [Pseudomonadota bacterium]
MTKVYPQALVPFVIEQNNATGAVSYWQGGAQQSEADADGISLAEYNHALFGLMRQAGAGKVLMIGLGGGTLATMLHRAGVKVAAVEIDAAIIELARGYFAMPEQIEIHVGDGAAFLKRDKRKFDAIVLDAYRGAEMPAHLATPDFFAVVKAHLAPGGICLLNLIVGDDDDPLPHEIGSRMKTAWRNVRLLDRPDWTTRNAILMAGRVKSLRRPYLLMKPRRRAKAIAAALKTLQFRPVLDRSL